MRSTHPHCSALVFGEHRSKCSPGRQGTDASLTQLVAAPRNTDALSVLPVPVRCNLLTDPPLSDC